MDKVLIIDTSDSSQTVVGLEIGSKKYFLKEKTGNLKSQNLLPLIEKILTKNRLTLKDLTGIKVNTGPGSFTGLRVGISVANALAFSLKIPVNRRKPGELVEPKYY